MDVAKFLKKNIEQKQQNIIPASDPKHGNKKKLNKRVRSIVFERNGSKKQLWVLKTMGSKSVV